jgi:TPP-dependent pyruvate/acetoin dehydrogenase alpha subunit
MDKPVELFRVSLGNLADPRAFHESLDISTTSSTSLVSFLTDMLRIRFAETRLATARRDGLIGGPVHLGVGQEAIAVGVSASLRSTDRIFGAHRSHSHLLALGSSVHKLFAEVLGKETGHSRGMGGSMHLWDQPRGFYGSVPIVAGTVALAVGAGLAAKLQRNSDVAVAYLGDGAVEEGVVHESLNLARIQNIPVLFVVENNLFASHMHISIRQPSDATARFAEANGIPFELVDGNDVIAMARVGREAVERARSGGGPSYIEAVTYRWYGHVDWRDDIDVGVNRSQADVSNWKARDPIARLRSSMVCAGIWSVDQDKDLQARIVQELDEAWDQAVRDPYPSEESLLERVYAVNGVKL